MCCNVLVVPDVVFINDGMALGREHQSLMVDEVFEDGDVDVCVGVKVSKKFRWID